MGDYFQIWPVVVGNEYLGFEYVSKYWVLGAGNANNIANQGSYTADTDTAIFPDRLLVTGLKLRYLDAKGFDSTAAQIAYATQLSIARANDSGSATLSMAPRPANVLISIDNAPDSGYGL